jgi:putative ABC transport system permease protein
MFRHLMKLIWKRKSRNLMLSLEILLAFIVVFAIVAIGTRMLELSQMPVGFQNERLWSVSIRTTGENGIPKDAVLYERMKRSLEAMPEVESVAYARFSLYTMTTWSTEFLAPKGGQKVRSHMMEVSDDFFATAGMKLTQGEWFSQADEGNEVKPVVVTRALADKLYPGENPIGKRFTDSEPDDKKQNVMRIRGVIEAFRNQGELMSPEPFALSRWWPHSSPEGAENILIKVKPGTTRDFEGKLNSQLNLVRNDWSYQIAPLTEMRETLMKEKVTPLIVVAVVAAFLLLMVAFGLFGVLWQNTTRRIPEIGLRRAIGASGGHIYRQIIAEQMLLSTVAMVAGLFLLVQLPITGALGQSLNWTVFLVASAVSMGIIYLLSLLCAVYPGWRASQLSPTEALHYE